MTMDDPTTHERPLSASCGREEGMIGKKSSPGNGDEASASAKLSGVSDSALGNDKLNKGAANSDPKASQLSTIPDSRVMEMKAPPRVKSEFPRLSSEVIPAEDEDIPVSTFPQRLMDILSKEEHTDIISWLPHGRGFIINDKKAFETVVMPKYFKKSKFTSFTRKLNRWSFNRVTRGPEAGAYYHELFKRDNIRLCMQMACKSEKPQALPLADARAWNQAMASVNSLGGNNNMGVAPMTSVMGGGTAAAANLPVAQMNNESILRMRLLEQQVMQQRQQQQQMALLMRNSTASQAQPSSTDNYIAMLMAQDKLGGLGGALSQQQKMQAAVALQQAAARQQPRATAAVTLSAASRQNRLNELGLGNKRKRSPKSQGMRRVSSTSSAA